MNTVMKQCSPLLAVWFVIVALLWPSMQQGILGHPIGDMSDHVWGSWWWGGEILAGRLPLFSQSTHLPEGSPLWHIDPLGALVMFVLRPLGPVCAWNGFILVQLFFAATASYLLGILVFKQRWLAGLMALFTASSPYMFGLIHSGLSEYLGVGWCCLFVRGLIAEKNQDNWKHLAILLGLCTWQAFYYGAFAVLLLLTKTAWQRQSMIRSVKITIGGTLIAAPAMLLGAWTLSGQGARFKQSAPGWDYRFLPSTDIVSWFRWGYWYHPDTPAMGNPGVLHVNYIGWVAIVVICFGLWKHVHARQWGKACLPFAIFSLGPALTVNRWHPSLAGYSIYLPMALLYAIPFSPFAMVHHPYRMMAFALPLLAIAFGWGLKSLPRWSYLLIGGLMVAENVLLSPAPWPIASTRMMKIDIPEPTGAVLNWPPDMTDGNRAYLLAQIYHQHPIAAGVNQFLSPRLRQDPLVNQLFRSMKHIQLRARNRDIASKERVLLPPKKGPSQLTQMGFQWIVLHPDFLQAKERKKIRFILQRKFGEPLKTGKNWELYRLGKP